MLLAASAAGNLIANGIVLAAVVGGIVVWIAFARRLRRGEPVLEYEPRRQVPWRGIDVLAVFSIYLAMEFVAASGVGPFHRADRASVEANNVQEDQAPGTEEAGTVKADREEVDAEVDVDHPVIDLLHQDGSLSTFLLCGLAAIVVAPILEEFLFRLVLQGWMEASERRRRRRDGRRRPWTPGTAPVVISSFIFAAVHYRPPQQRMEPEVLRDLLLYTTMWHLATLALGIALLRWRTGARAVDLGFIPRKLVGDVRLGILAFVAIAGPIYLLQNGLTWILQPLGIPADPITLFFFALVLGILYYRTHRLVPAIVLHMLLNACSLALAWLLVVE